MKPDAPSVPSVLTAISSVFSATYDGDGTRATKTEGGTETYFIYSGDVPVIEETYNGTIATISAVNVWGADGWRARYYPGTPEFYGFNFDPEGNVTNQQDSINTLNPGFCTTFYEAYGHLGNTWLFNAHTMASNYSPAGFGAQWGYYTDTYSILMGHRYYGLKTGRFLNRDPEGYGGGINLYAYATDPINEFDPSGFGAPDGHHFFPQIQFRRAGLSSEALKIFDSFGVGKTGLVPKAEGGHYNTGAHRVYSPAVRDLWEQYIQENKIVPSQMTTAQAEGFLGKIKTSTNPAIKDFLTSIAEQFAQNAATTTDSVERATSVKAVFSILGKKEGVALLGRTLGRAMDVIEDLNPLIMELDFIGNILPDPVEWQNMMRGLRQNRVPEWANPDKKRQLLGSV